MTIKVAQRIYPRGLNLAAALKSQSSFLLGPRMTGKSTLIRETLPDALVFDLLNSEDFLPLLESPSFLGRTIPFDTEIVVIDEEFKKLLSCWTKCTVSLKQEVFDSCSLDPVPANCDEVVSIY